MTIRRTPRPQLRRQVGALLLSGAVLCIVSVTARSATAQSALEALARQGDLAQALLRSQLGDWQERTGLPGGTALAIGQSPLLLAAREPVLDLRRTGETDSAGDPSQPLPPLEPAEPVPEEPAEPAEPEEPLRSEERRVRERVWLKV